MRRTNVRMTLALAFAATACEPAPGSGTESPGGPLDAGGESLSLLGLWLSCGVPGCGQDWGRGAVDQAVHYADDRTHDFELIEFRGDGTYTEPAKATRFSQDPDGPEDPYDFDLTAPDPAAKVEGTWELEGGELSLFTNSTVRRFDVETVSGGIRILGTTPNFAYLERLQPWSPNTTLAGVVGFEYFRDGVFEDVQMWGTGSGEDWTPHRFGRVIELHPDGGVFAAHTFAWGEEEPRPYPYRGRGGQTYCGFGNDWCVTFCTGKGSWRRLGAGNIEIRIGEGRPRTGRLVPSAGERVPVEIDAEAGEARLPSSSGGQRRYFGWRGAEVYGLVAPIREVCEAIGVPPKGARNPLDPASW